MSLSLSSSQSVLAIRFWVFFDQIRHQTHLYHCNSLRHLHSDNVDFDLQDTKSKQADAGLQSDAKLKGASVICNEQRQLRLFFDRRIAVAISQVVKVEISLG